MNIKIDRGDWPSFADTFSENNQGRPVSIERVSETVVSETIAEKAPLVALDFDDLEPDAMLITVGTEDEEALTHTITDPQTVWLYSDAEGKALSLEILTPDNAKTIVRFENS